MKQGSLISTLLGVMVLMLFVRPQAVAQDNDDSMTVEPALTVQVTVTFTPTVETPMPTVDPSPTSPVTLTPTVEAPTPTNLISHQGIIETKPANTNVGIWIIEGVTIQADGNTQFIRDDGPLTVGGCALVVYFFDGTFNIAVSIQSQPLTVCEANLPSPSQTPLPTAETITWRGTVTLQGRDQHGGINILMSDQPCGAATFSQPITTTDAMGNFEITTTQTYQCFKAEYPLYLSVEQSISGPEISPVMLKGGDVDGDGIINIIDIAALARNFETNNPAFDLNADGIIDIFDLVLAASNFQR